MKHLENKTKRLVDSHLKTARPPRGPCHGWLETVTVSGREMASSRRQERRDGPQEAENKQELENCVDRGTYEIS